MSRTSVFAAFVLLAICAQQVLAARGPQVLNTDYKVMIRMNEERPSPDGSKNWILGAQLDKDMKPLLDGSGNPRLANNPDFTSYIKSGGELFAITQMEVGPGAYYVMGLDQDNNGKLTVNNLQPVDYGIWEPSIRPCSGSISPWNSHLAAEESYPNLRTIVPALRAGNTNDGTVRDLMAYHGYYVNGSTDAAKASANGAKVLLNAEFAEMALKTLKLYQVGTIVEIKVVGGTPTFSKHLALGRASWEAALVMPDKMTVYLTDDAGTAGGFTKFVAKYPNNLSQGTLYSAKIVQTNAVGSDSLEANIEWIKLADVDQDILFSYVNKPIGEFNFDHIFLAATPNADATCPTDYKPVNWEGTFECLKLNTTTPHVEMLAAALETRRYLTFMGASAQLSKLEGIALDKARMRLYYSISYQQNSMLVNGTGDRGSTDDVKVKGNTCGCLYTSKLDDKYSAINIRAQVCGIETPGQNYSCSLNTIAGPDNVAVMQKLDWVIIYEDAGGSRRPQDCLWAHNVVTKETIRLAAAEDGAEVTGGSAYVDWNKGYSFISVNFQGVDGHASPIGYLGPWKIKSKKITFQEHIPKGPDYVWPNF